MHNSLLRENKFIADFKEKAVLFNHYFVNQCFFLSNNSVFPTDLPQLTNKCIDSIYFSSSGIAKIISRSDPNKAQDHDMLSVRMMKLYGSSICKPLSIIFSDRQMRENFLMNGKKLTLYPYRRKGTNRL